MYLLHICLFPLDSYSMVFIVYRDASLHMIYHSFVRSFVRACVSE
jgi:hypothetical protein